MSAVITLLVVCY